MSIRIASAAVSLLLFSSWIGAKEHSSAPVLVDVMWDISLDASGNITKLATRDERIPTLHARLEKAIRGWHFSSGKVNGQPAATDSHLSISLEFTPVSGGYAMRLRGVGTGGDYKKKTAPDYPPEAAEQHRQGEVVLLVHYDSSGAVVNVAPYEFGPQVDRRLVRAAIASVKRWTFAPEVVGGHPVAADALVPLCFSLQNLTPPACNWKNPATGENLGDSQAISLNPAARLESDVIGHAL